MAYAFEEMDNKSVAFLMTLENIAGSTLLTDREKFALTMVISTVFGDQESTPEDMAKRIDEWVAETFPESTRQQRIEMRTELSGFLDVLRDLGILNDTDVEDKPVEVNVTGKEKALEDFGEIDDYRLDNKDVYINIWRTTIRSTIDKDPPYIAEGGPVVAGKQYLIGEKGPEMFVSEERGRVIPNKSLGGGGGTTVNFYYQPTISTASSHEVERIMAPAIISILRKENLKYA